MSGRRIEGEDGKFYRERRGKLVQIPDEWVGQIPTERTIRNRPSKWIGKRKRDHRWGGAQGPIQTEFKDRRDSLQGQDFGDANFDL